MTDAPERIWIKTDDPNNRPFVTRGPLAALPYTEYVRADLAKPKVKPLVWDEWDGGLTVAKTPLGKFILSSDLVMSSPFWAYRRYETPEAAKSAAQADYERRILEALEDTYE